jgi:CRISPR-associated protein Cmr1
MKKLEARFRIVTPMFLGDPNQKADTVRPASVKGALRFWWRALNWSRCLEHEKSIEVDALKYLQGEEARLFGIAAGDDNGGQGIFLLQVSGQKITLAEQPFKPLEGGQLYLLGQGLATFKNGNSCLRNAIREGGEFGVKLIFRPNASEPDIKQVSDALYLFGLLGALGSRARHGMGSVALIECESRSIPQTAQEYAEILKVLLENTNAKAEPPFTAFSDLTRIDVSSTNADALKLLNVVGSEQQMYRSFGKDGMVNNHKPSEFNFRDDHDLIRGATGGKPIDHAPRRVVFGLPHNYFFSTKVDGHVNNADVNYSPNRVAGRRASPLLLHIHPVGEQFIAVHTLLRARFLPEDAKISIKTRGTVDVKSAPDWGVLHNYLNRYVEKNIGKIIHGRK